MAKSGYRKRIGVAESDKIPEVSSNGACEMGQAIILGAECNQKKENLLRCIQGVDGARAV